MKIVIPIERFRDIYKKEAYAFADRLRDGFIFLIVTEDYDTDSDLAIFTTKPEDSIPLSQETLPILNKLTYDKNRYVRKGALQTLSKIRDYLLKLQSKYTIRTEDQITNLNGNIEYVTQCIKLASEVDTDLSVRVYSKLCLGLETNFEKIEIQRLAKESLRGEKDLNWYFDINLNLKYIFGYDSIWFKNLLKLLERNLLTEKQKKIVLYYKKIKEDYVAREKINPNIRIEVDSFAVELYKQGFIWSLKS